MSAGFSEEMMRQRLQTLSNTTHSIQTLSLWLIHHQRKHANVILTTWLKEIQEQTSSQRLTSLINLANDVIQNCRKKHPEFMKNFLEVLQPGFCHICEVGDGPCKKSTERIISVWKDRQIYSHDEIELLKQCLSGADALSSPPYTIIDSKTPPDSSTEASPTTSNENSQQVRLEFKNFAKITTNLVNCLRKFEDPASADAKIRQLIASYPETIANPLYLKQLKSQTAAEDLLNKINEAKPVINTYCGRLKTELEDRRTVQNLLDDYMKALNKSSERNLNLIKSVRKKVNCIDDEKKEMIKHIESLPDLNEMFNETSSVLPSLGELFK